MVRDLVEIAIDNVREEKLEDVADKAELNAEERLLDILLPPTPPRPEPSPSTAGGVVIDGGTQLVESSSRTREKLRQQLREGKLDERMVEIDVRERNFPSFEILTNQGVEEMDVNIKDMLPNIFGQRTKKRKMKVNEAFEYLIQEEEQRLIDMDQVTRMLSPYRHPQNLDDAAHYRVAQSVTAIVPEFPRKATAQKCPFVSSLTGA